MDGQDRSDARSEGRSMGQGGREVGDREETVVMMDGRLCINSSSSNQLRVGKLLSCDWREITNLYYIILF